ncbi:MAG: fructosamine kinase family protein [Methylomonas sp.]|jgi:fructosamine-3-kinase
MATDLQSLVGHLEQATGRNLQDARLSSVGGGDINSAYKLQAREATWFIKLNRAQLREMFAAEAAGLQALAAGGALRAPETVAYGSFQHYAYLVLEHIELTSLRGAGLSRFGEQLAEMHRPAQAYFGWTRDNTIGSTPQSNRRHDDWPSFWRRERLGQQLELAARNGYNGALQTRGEKLLAGLDGFFSAYQPHPALLHGDLWGGNAAADRQGDPVIFDPACYYGDREADVAMTELFGGFGNDFYAAYHAALPLDAGYKARKTLYNLYHILNHLNLFGSGYLRQANNMMDTLLAELG